MDCHFLSFFLSEQAVPARRGVDLRGIETTAAPAGDVPGAWWRRPAAPPRRLAAAGRRLRRHRQLYWTRRQGAAAGSARLPDPRTHH